MHYDFFPKTGVIALVLAACSSAGQSAPTVSPTRETRHDSSALVEFRLVRDQPVPNVATQLYEGDTVYLDSVPLISDTDLSSLRPDATVDRLLLRFQLTQQAAAVYQRQTAANIGRRLALLLEGRVASIAVIRSPLGERGVIEARMPRREAERLALLIRARWRDPAAGSDTSSLALRLRTSLR